MHTPTILTALFLLSATALRAANGDLVDLIPTNSGKVYTHCRIVKTDPDGVIIAHQHGGAKILFADLAEDVRQKLGYDASAAAAYEQRVAERRATEREALWKYRTELAKVEAAAYAVEARRLDVLAVQSAAGSYGVSWPNYGWQTNGYADGCGHRLGYGPTTYLREQTRSRVSGTSPNASAPGVRSRTAPGAKSGARAPMGTPAMGPLTPALGK
ncbi:MAG: hypothetical protein ACOYMN_03770 [Roseimicrobium sp.]